MINDLNEIILSLIQITQENKIIPFIIFCICIFLIILTILSLIVDLINSKSKKK